MDGVQALLKAHALDAGDIFVFKIGRMGGITKIKQVHTFTHYFLSYEIVTCFYHKILD